MVKDSRVIALTSSPGVSRRGRPGLLNGYGVAPRRAGERGLVGDDCPAGESRYSRNGTVAPAVRRDRSSSRIAQVDDVGAQSSPDATLAYVVPMQGVQSVEPLDARDEVNEASKPLAAIRLRDGA
jgi:hypothetical protein